MKNFFSRIAQYIWYEDVFIATWLTVFTLLFIDVVKFRRFLYRKGIFKSSSLPCPVIIVGNISVGGTGKTPLVITLANYLKQEGFRPGIISRGYGGHHQEDDVISVSAGSDPYQVGDETVLIAKQTNCPVAVAAKRVEAAQWLLKNTDCNIILSDDGLQHYALKRDIEIAVVDGERRFGNNNCLPGGPLREPLERLNEVDFIIVNGTPQEQREIAMTIKSDIAINLSTGEQKSLSEFKEQPCHALAGIGHPLRFFNLLAAHGLTTKNHSFPDHHIFTAKEINFSDQKPVLMTEKDAVKCTAIATDKHWYVPINAHLPDTFYSQLLTKLNKTDNGQKTA
jgi:tetraacyldisaccharide 4'-kinase